MKKQEVKRVCVVTGSRAEYGVLHRLIKKIIDSKTLEFKLIVTGAHLSSEHGSTVSEIESDGVPIDERVVSLLSSDTDIATGKSLGFTVIGLTEALARLKPNLVVLLGDRFEIFAAAAASTVLNYPIVHLHGGERGEGAFDEAFRHAITKMASLHLVATEEYRSRVIQLGEQPKTVFNVGALGVENIRVAETIDRGDVEEFLGIQLLSSSLLVTWHPVTLEPGNVEAEFGELLSALGEVRDTSIIFTKSNADTEGKKVNKMIDEFVIQNPVTAVGVQSLGRVRYLSCLKLVSAVVGNSSSGIIEAPSVPVGTVNIGDRQRGRARAKSVIDCRPIKLEIQEAIEKVMSSEFRSQITEHSNPYEGGSVSDMIVEILENVKLSETRKKEFFDIELNGF